MRTLLIIAFLLVIELVNAQKTNKMKLNAGIVTEKLQESKSFYTKVLDFGVVFENEFYILMQAPNKLYEISFLQPNHPSQKPIFQPSFGGKGVYLTIEVENVDEIYQQIIAKNIPIAVELRNEVWGDRHFAIVDPNGVGIDIVTHTKLEE